MSNSSLGEQIIDDGGKEMDLFTKGSICVLRTSVWPGKTVLPKDAVETAATDKNWARGEKLLIDPKHLKELNNIRARAWTFLRSQAVPFPFEGAVVISHSRVPYVNQKMVEFQAEFTAAVQKLADNFANYKEEAKLPLGPLWDAADYPVDIKHTCRMGWQLYAIQGPDKALAAVAPDLYAQQVKGMKTLFAEAREMGIAAVREELLKVVQHAVERLSGVEKKTFHSSTISKFTDFFNKFADRNIWGDQELEEIVNQAKQVLQGITPAGLRDAAGLRQNVAAELAKAEVALVAAMAPAKRRIIQDD